MANWGNIFSRGNVEDRRSMAPAVGGLSLTGLALLFLFNVAAGGSPEDFLQQLQTLPVEQQSVDSQQFAGQDDYEIFASTVLGSSNDMWKQVFAQRNQTYQEPRLVLFRTATQSACGLATSDVGPFYCPNDQTIYLDETFFDELTRRFGAQGGDVAQAYVIAHEVGHHAQNELGLLQKRPDGTALELQADCFAGLWVNSIKDQQVLEPGEVREAMDAAAAVGDDRIQETVGEEVNPETWTHGSSEQRMQAFDKGYNTGNLQACMP